MATAPVTLESHFIAAFRLRGGMLNAVGYDSHILLRAVVAPMAHWQYGPGR